VPNLVQVALSSSGLVSIYNHDGNTDVIADVVGYVVPGLSGTGGLYNPVSPFRVGDTRPSSGFQGSGRTLGPGDTRMFRVSGIGAVPAGHVSAVALNVTVTNPTAGAAGAPNFLTVYPASGSRPLASNLNYVAAQVVANRVIVPLTPTPDGDVAVYNFAGQADVVVDVVGWFTDGSDSSASGSMFNPISPIRLCDTRDVPYAAGATPCAGSTLVAGGALNIQASGVAGMPAMGTRNAPTAVVVNVTATNTTAGSFLTAYPGPASANPPAASDLNWIAGETRANLVIVRLGPDGTFNLYNLGGYTDVIVDLMGWYSSP
jgi:hypothetical protein